MRKNLLRFLSAVMSVVMFMFSGVTPFSAAAEGEVDGNSVLSIIDSEACINDIPISDGQAVHDGDKLSLSLKWELSNDAVSAPVVIRYNMSNDLKGVSINSQTINVPDTNGNTIAVYQVVGQDILIDLKEGASGRSGSCSLEGVIDVSPEDTDENGNFDFVFFGKCVKLKAPDTVPSLKASKWGTSFRKSGDKYYQDFEIRVYSDNGIAADNVTVKDIYPVGVNSVYTGSISDIKVNGASASADISEGSASVNIGTVSADRNSPTVITYSVEINADNILNPPQSVEIGKDNKAEVYYNNEKKAEATAYPTYQTPYISKSGVLTGTDNDRIQWTVTVTPNMLEGTDFVLTDIIDGKLSFADISPSIPGAQKVDDVTFTVPRSAFTHTSDGRYELTYTTVLDDEYAQSISPVSFKNRAKVKFDGLDVEYNTETTVSTRPAVTDYITKNVKEVNGDRITWTVKATIPDTNKLGTVKITDSTTEWSEKQGYHTIDMSSLKITDGNGSLVAAESAVASVSNNDYSHTGVITWFELTLVSDFANANKGKVITFEYDTVINGSHSLIYKNKAGVNISLTDDTNINDSDTDQYTADISADKFAFGRLNELTDTTGKINPLGWYVNVYAADHTYHAGDVITVNDTLPEGYSFISGSAKLGITNNIYYIDYRNSAYQSYLSTAVNGQNVTFTITLTDDDIAAKLSGNSGFFVSVAYATEMTKEYAAEFNSVRQTKAFTNSASVTAGGVVIGGLSATQSLESNPELLVDKVISDEGVTSAGDAYASYVVDINEAEAEIGSGATITAIDRLGSGLELAGSVNITPSEGASYTVNDGVIEFTLSNSKHYRIEYSVKVHQIGKNDNLSQEQINDKFANTITVIGSGSSGVNDVALIASGTYRSNAEYIFDQNTAYITLSGTKFWNDAKNTGARPSKIKIVLTEKKFDPSGNPAGSPVDHDYEVTPTGDNWSYTIENLITKDAARNTYKYNIKEVTVDGYDITYTVNGTSLTQVSDITGGVANQPAEGITIDIRNTFTLDTTEVGSLKVTKNWVGDAGAEANRPTELTITVSDLSGNYTDKKTIDVAGGGTYVTFDNLPLYTYSRDAQDNLVKTPRLYYIKETHGQGGALQNYVLTYPGTQSEGKTVFTLSDSGVKDLQIYNTFTTQVGQLTVKKEWVGDNDISAVARPSEIKVTVSDLFGNDYEKTINIAGGETEAVFTDLPVYTYTTDSEGNPVPVQRKYYITESAVSAENRSLLSNYVFSYNGTQDSSGRKIITLSTGNNSITVTNTFESENGRLAVTKSWIGDLNTAASTRPSEITVTVSDVDGVYTQTKTINAASGSTVVFENLPRYRYSRNAQGTLIRTPIKYYITESANSSVNRALLENYTSSYPGTVSGNKTVFELSAVGDTALTIRNTFNSEAGKLIVTKSWSGDLLSASTTRPSEITVTVSDLEGRYYTDTKTINIAAGSTAVFEGLPRYSYSRNSQGGLVKTPIKYYITESANSLVNRRLLDSYTLSYPGTVSGTNTVFALSSTGDTSLTIKNTFISETGSIKVTKSWANEPDSTGLTRPSEITVTVSSLDGSYSKTADIVLANGSEAVFSDLPLYTYSADASGALIRTPIKYYVTESAQTAADRLLLAKYVLSYDGTVDAASGHKVFELSPSSTVQLGITNTFVSEVGNLKVTKSWANEPVNAGSPRPSEITVTVSSLDGSYSKTADIVLANGSEAVFSDLPLYTYSTGANGELVRTPIEYYITESTASAADRALLQKYALSYPGTVSGNNTIFALSTAGDTAVTITNTFIPEVGSLKVTKSWANEPDSTGSARPSEITVTVSRLDGSYSKTADIVLANGSEAVFSNLPLYTYSTGANGELVRTPIEYYITESAASAADRALLERYTLSYRGTERNGKTVFALSASGEFLLAITNTYHSAPTPPAETTTASSAPQTPSDTTTTAGTTTTTAPSSAATTAPSSAVTTTAVTTAPEVTKGTTDTTRPPKEEIVEIPEDDDDDADTGEIDRPTTEITDEENPDTGIAINWQLVASAVFAAAAIVPQRKKKKN